MEKRTFNIEEITEGCITWIKEWFEDNGKDCVAVVGISGGKDSTVTAALCVEALGKDRVIGILMPCGEQKDIEDSYKVANHLGIKHFVANIEPAVNDIYDKMARNQVEISLQTKTNLPARIRMSTLYAFSQSLNGRVANTCNFSEDFIGWSTRWGDAVGDFAPLKWLTTRQIRAIGDYLGLPHELVHKTPIDGLTFNEDGSYKSDEDNLGVTYDEIDDYLESNYSPQAVSEKAKTRIMELSSKNQFKQLDLPSYMPQWINEYAIHIF